MPRESGAGRSPSILLRPEGAQLQRHGVEWFDTRDHVATATASNLFVVHDGTLLTPPRSCGVLPGITRAAVIECARGGGLAVVERELGTDDLRQAREAFLTNSIREIVPLVRVGGSAIGTGRPGAVTRSIMESYAALVRRECDS